MSRTGSARSPSTTSATAGSGNDPSPADPPKCRLNTSGGNPRSVSFHGSRMDPPSAAPLVVDPAKVPDSQVGV